MSVTDRKFVSSDFIIQIYKILVTFNLALETIWRIFLIVILPKLFQEGLRGGMNLHADRRQALLVLLFCFLLFIKLENKKVI